MSNILYEQIKTELDLPVRFAIYQDIETFVPLHWHKSLEIIYILEGSMLVTVTDQEYRITKDNFIIINSRDIHMTHVSEKTIVLLLQIPYEFLKTCIPDYDFIRFEGYWTPFQDPNKNIIRTLLRQMRSIYEKKEEGFFLHFSSLLYELLYKLVQEYKIEISSDTKSKAEHNLKRLELITSYVQQHFRETISIKDAASLLHINEAYFCRFFKKYMGITFLEYVNSIRMKHIYEDIIKTDQTILEITEKNGFYNYKVFMRLFKATYGCTPLKKRKSIQS